MVFLEQFCGCYTLLFSMKSVFEGVHDSAISADVGCVIVSVIQVCGAYAGSHMIDRFGRKFLYSTCPFLVAIFMIIYGVSNQLLDDGHSSTFISFLPVFSLAASIFLANVGIFSLTFVVLSEISPSNVKSQIFMIAMIFSFIFSTIVLLGRSSLD